MTSVRRIHQSSRVSSHTAVLRKYQSVLLGSCFREDRICTRCLVLIYIRISCFWYRHIQVRWTGRGLNSISWNVIIHNPASFVSQCLVFGILLRLIRHLLQPVYPEKVTYAIILFSKLHRLILLMCHQVRVIGNVRHRYAVHRDSTATKILETAGELGSDTYHVERPIEIPLFSGKIYLVHGGHRDGASDRIVRSEV